MSLSDLAALGSFVSGIAVLISLVYLSLQIRQAEKNQQAAIRQGRVARIVDLGIAACEPSAADAFDLGNSGSESLTRTQIAQYRHLSRCVFYNWEDSFYQHKEGLLDEAGFRNFINSARSGLTMTGLRVAWKQNRDSYGKEFAALIDKIIAETALAPTPDPVAAWKSDLAAEKAMAAASS
jgi:hypothetical protein